jgi:hypothetical protein
VSRAALFVALLLAAAGCRTAPTRLPLAADDPRPSALLRAWQAGAEARRALRGSARLAVDGDGPPVRARQILVVERPSRLRVEVQGLLSQTLAVIVTDGPRYQLFRAEDRSFESGEVRPGLLRQVASLDLTPEEAIDLVLGVPRPGAGLAPAGAYTTKDGEVDVELAEPDGQVRERRVFDAQGRLRRVEHLGEDGAAAWSARFDEYRPVGGVPFAHTIRVEAGRTAARAELVLSGVELNPALPADIFQLRPAGSGGQTDGEGG